MNIAIAGYGLEGQSNLKYFRKKFPDANFTIFDESIDVNDIAVDVEMVAGEEAFKKIQNFDLVVRTAGLAPYKIAQKDKTWSSTREFFKECPAQIIGVTGTKGKGTTASLVVEILRAAGKTVHLLGNIGVPALSELPNIKSSDIVVYELSSFQLWDLERSPHIAIITLIEPDHLNVHENMDDYVGAKTNIRRWQTDSDLCVYHPTNELSRKIALSNQKGKTVRYAAPEDEGVYVSENYFCQSEQKICSVDALQLLGMHNVENACAALTVAKYCNISDEDIEMGLKKFKGLPHRIEFVREIDGVKYYNDSFASAPSASVAAVKSFTQPEVVILGGIDKGADWTELAEAIKSHNIRKLVLIGQVRNKLLEFLKQNGVTAPIESTDVKTMPEIVAIARNSAELGDVVILSPGHASFDMFKNFYDRGDQFRDEVNRL